MNFLFSFKRIFFSVKKHERKCFPSVFCDVTSSPLILQRKVYLYILIILSDEKIKLNCNLLFAWGLLFHDSLESITCIAFLCHSLRTIFRTGDVFSYLPFHPFSSTLGWFVTICCRHVIRCSNRSSCCQHCLSLSCLGLFSRVYPGNIFSASNLKGPKTFVSLPLI